MTTLLGNLGSLDPVDRSTTVQSPGSCTVSGASGFVTISIDYGEARINGGSWIAAAYILWERVQNGDVIEVRHTSSSAFDDPKTTTLDVDGATNVFTSRTLDADYTPDVVNLSVSGVEPGSLNYSSGFYITGINTRIDLNDVAGTAGTPQGSKNSGAWGNYFDQIFEYDYFQLRGYASASFNTAVTVKLRTNIYTQDSAIFTITTRAADITPNAFSFTAQGSVAKLTPIVSNSVTMAGMDAGQNCPLTFSNKTGGTAFEIRINGGSWQDATGTINIQNGQTLECRITTPNTDSTTCTMTVTANGTVSSTFSVTTTTPDTTPDQWTFVDNANVALSNTVESNLVTITGITAAISINLSASGGSAQQYNYNNGGWTNIGGGVLLPTVVSGDTLKLRMTVPGTAGQYGEITVSGGTGPVSDVWRATAQAADTAPDAFSFAAVTGVDPNQVVNSAPITVAGINTYSAGTAITVTGGKYRINGGSWTTAAGTVYPGDTVEAQVTAAGTLITTVSATVTIGGVAGAFSVTTRSPNTNAQYVVTFRDSKYGVGF